MIKVLTFYNKAYNLIGDKTAELIGRFCLKNDFSFVVDQSEFVEHPFFRKLHLVDKTLRDCDVLLYLDVDTLILKDDGSVVRDMAATITQPKGPKMMASMDRNGVCMGAFMIRNCQWSHDLMQAMKFLGPVTEKVWRAQGHKDCGDQSSLKLLMDSYSKVNGEICVVGSNVITNPEAPFEQDALAFHMWANRGNHQDILGKIEEFKTNGWSPKVMASHAVSP